MPDNKFVLPRSTLELLDSVPESLLRRLKQYSGRLATEAVSTMQDRLPFFGELEASQRASVALVESKDGLQWSGPPKIVLGPRRETGWESDINRPVVVTPKGAKPCRPAELVKDLL